MKERLTGAIILVALIVLLVPELLTGPVRSAPRSVAVASSAEEPPLRSYTIKLADEPRAREALSRSGPEQPAPLAAAPPPATATPVPAGEATSGSGSASSAGAASAPVPTHPPASSPTRATAAVGAAESTDGYVVQLGSFASRANAERLARQVHAQGFVVSVSQGSSGHLYRVRVGPAHDRAGASELAQQLQAHGHDGKIVPQ
ncbi:MAG TPA: SPOR domain-containing protein [Steroidobacteraceae bacterium]|nr:SPOR domain-containing protein [Steroidobacteraceae bacterium]